MQIAFAAPGIPETGAIVAGVLDDQLLTETARRLDLVLAGSIGRAMAASRFRGKKEQALTLMAPGGSRLDRVVLVGLGAAKDLDALRAQAIGGQIYVNLVQGGAKEAVVAVDAIEGCPLAGAELACQMAAGARLRSYRFAKYFTKEKIEDKPELDRLVFAVAEPARAQALYASEATLADAVFFTRDLVSEPANVLYPETLAEAARSLSGLGVEVEVLGEKEMRALGMNALLGVGQGSDHPSRLVVMQWWGRSRPAGTTAAAGEAQPAPLAFVGKGVTFDTGGISIKPAASMEEMKWDMAGAATVIGLMRALAARGAQVDAVGVVGLVENMPSGKAQRPGDVVRSMSGQTIEVINTDAEGRLVLADALWYTKERFKPRLIVDLATLTGAIIIALGHEKAGLFTNDDALAERLTAAGAAVGEPVWRLPLGCEYDKLIKSDIADMKNVGDRSAGSISAAQFLQRFVDKTPWAHIDIAGVAWSKKDRDVTPKGASAFGVRLLDRFVAQSYEAQSYEAQAHQAQSHQAQDHDEG